MKEKTPRKNLPIAAHRADCILAPVRRSQQPGRFAERVVEGVDDGGSAERIVLWIERKEGGVWAVGRAVNPQHRPSSEPRPEDYFFEGYELQDALDAGERRARGRRERGRARRLDRPPSAVQAQRDPRAAGALVLRQDVILVVARDREGARGDRRRAHLLLRDRARRVGRADRDGPRGAAPGRACSTSASRARRSSRPARS